MRTPTESVIRIGREADTAFCLLLLLISDLHRLLLLHSCLFLLLLNSDLHRLLLLHFLCIDKKKSRHKMSKKPIDTDLYEEVREEAKRRFAVWPSAYASGWLVRTYKARGGRYAGDRRRSPKKNEATGIDRWFREKWVDACFYLETGRMRACGRKRAESTNYRLRIV